MARVLDNNGPVLTLLVVAMQTGLGFRLALIILTSKLMRPTLQSAPPTAAREICPLPQLPLAATRLQDLLLDKAGLVQTAL